MSAYYNENDPVAAHVLKCLADKNIIAPGDVDSRSITEVHPDDLRGYTQCHFFAGGGFWSIAARLAGWPDDRALWTGSCPCQPFSAAGKGKGADDPRHLWPHLYRLVCAARPAVIMGEQVSGKAGYGWVDGVKHDLETEDYTCGRADIAACAVDAPHQRARLWWFGHRKTSDGVGTKQAAGCAIQRAGEQRQPGQDAQVHAGQVADAENKLQRTGDSAVSAGEKADARQARGQDGRGVTGNPQHPGLERHAWHVDRGQERSEENRSVPSSDGSAGGLLENTHNSKRRPESKRSPNAESSQGERKQDTDSTDKRDGSLSYWSNSEWIECYDGKARRTQPGIRFLVDGFPRRVDAWRIAGNAIVPQVAAEVIGAYMDVYDGASA